MKAVAYRYGSLDTVRDMDFVELRFWYSGHLELKEAEDAERKRLEKLMGG